MNWRPDCWVNPHDFRNPDHVDNPYVEMECANSYEAGASAMLSALLVYLDESCDKHGRKATRKTVAVETYDGREHPPTIKTEVIYPDHRYLCSECMAELRGEK
jgi:hypothetical protein